MGLRPRTRRCALALALCLAVSACGAGEGERAGGPGGAGAPEALRAAIVSDEGTINPYTYQTGMPGYALLMLQYDSLLQIDTAGEPQPWLAETVEVSEDGRTYDITLAEGVTWHDGEQLTAADVAFTFEYFLENTHPRFTSNLAGVLGATANEDGSVTISLDAPRPSFPLTALADVPVIPEHIWSGVEDPENHQFEGANVGSGPYRLVGHEPGRSYRFEANPDYFRGAPAVRELVVVQFADATGALAAMRAGEVDVFFGQVPPEQIETLDAQGSIEIAQGPEFTTQLLYYDATRAPFDDAAVRRAISMAIDRQDLVDTVYLGAATAGSAGWVHPDHPLFNPDVETTTDVEAAAAALEEAGYTDRDGDGIREHDGQPMRFELITPSDDPLRVRLAELISDMLGEIGIDAQVSPLERTTWEEQVWPGFDVAGGRNYELAIWGWSAPVQADIGRFGWLVHSDPSVGTLNLTGFSNEEIDAVVTELAIEPDQAERAGLVDRLQVLVAQHLPFVTLLHPDGAYAYDAQVYDDWAFIAGHGIVNKLSLLPEAARP